MTLGMVDPTKVMRVQGNKTRLQWKLNNACIGSTLLSAKYLSFCSNNCFVEAYFGTWLRSCYTQQCRSVVGNSCKLSRATHQLTWILRNIEKNSPIMVESMRVLFAFVGRQHDTSYVATVDSLDSLQRVTKYVILNHAHLYSIAPGQ